MESLFPKYAQVIFLYFVFESFCKCFIDVTMFNCHDNSPIIFWFSVLNRIMNACLVNISKICYQQTTFSFWINILFEIIRTGIVVIFTYSLLIYFYIKWHPLQQTSRSTFYKDYIASVVITIFYFLFNLSDRHLETSIEIDKLDKIVESLALMFIPMDIDVCGPDENEMKTKKAYYEQRYGHIRLSFSKTNAYSESHQQMVALKKEGSPEPLPIAHGYLVRNSDEIELKHICQMCKLILREPCRLHCGHRQCQSCVFIQNE